MTNIHSTADQEAYHCKSREIVSMPSWAEHVSKRFAYKIENWNSFQTERRHCLRPARSTENRNTNSAFSLKILGKLVNVDLSCCIELPRQSFLSSYVR